MQHLTKNERRSQVFALAFVWAAVFASAITGQFARAAVDAMFAASVTWVLMSLFPRVCNAYEARYVALFELKLELDKLVKQLEEQVAADKAYIATLEGGLFDASEMT